MKVLPLYGVTCTAAFQCARDVVKSNAPKDQSSILFLKFVNKSGFGKLIFHHIVGIFLLVNNFANSVLEMTESLFQLYQLNFHLWRGQMSSDGRGSVRSFV